MFIEAAVLGIIAGYIRGGRLSNLKEVHFTHAWTVFVAIILQFSLSWLQDILGPWTGLIHILSYVFLFAFLMFNFKPAGIKIIGLGILLNFMVIAANFGTMPVAVTGMPVKVIQELKTGRDGIHSLLTDSSRLAFLGDVIKIKHPLHGKLGWFSIGDIIMDIGLILLISECMLDGAVYYKVTSVKRTRS